MVFCSTHWSFLGWGKYVTLASLAGSPPLPGWGTTLNFSFPEERFSVTGET